MSNEFDEMVNDESFDEIFKDESLDEEVLRRLFGEESDEEKQQRLEEEARKLLEVGFLPKNKELNETMHTSMEYVEADPRRFIIEECIPACQELWKKNIYTYMVSDHLDADRCWVEVEEKSLSDENREIYEALEGEDVIKFAFHPCCLNFGIKGIGTEGQQKLLEVAQKFKMQDVPEDLAYCSLEDYLVECGCYKEVTNPDYVPMTPPEEMSLPDGQEMRYLLDYYDWLDSDFSQATVKEFDPSKVTEPLESYFEGKDVVCEGDRVYLSNYHYQKHLNYVNSMDDSKTVKPKS